jgi:cell wall-associated NlpC family hydrolase
VTQSPDITRLIAACESWQGTPFCPNSQVKGAGVCCHRFCGAAYVEAGWLPPIDLPDGNPYGSDTASESPFETWLNNSPHFVPVFDAAQMEPGDLILSKPSRLPWHLAIYLGDGVFAHVDMRQGVQVTNSFPDVWAKRIVRIYRPVTQ